MKTLSIQMNQQQIDELRKKFKPYITDKKIPYALFQIKLSDCTITAYESMKVVYQGEELDLYVPQNKASYPQAGSDEVGCGDYFGPVVVCACILHEKDIELLNQFNIKDSKQLTDKMILDTVPKILDSISHSLLILDTVKYNQIHKTNNLNQIKAKLHNQAYVHLKKKVGSLPSLSVVDQFAPEKNYYQYLSGEKEIIRGLTFETKAESKYLAVAVASMIARYAFLKAWEKMEEYYECSIPKGAGNSVDAFAQEFVNQHGLQELERIAKMHFKNTDKLNI